MIDISKMRWKYLRGSEKNGFSKDRNTTLSEYLDYMFQNNTFVYDKMIPKDIIVSRNPDAEIRKFRPDARCEELSLVVEFDGLPHYQDSAVVLSDANRDKYLVSLGYTVVRIPYWVQLTKDVIFHLFSGFLNNLTIDGDSMCMLKSSFHDEDSDTFKLSVSIGAMCIPGAHRFVREVRSLPLDIQIEIYDDIRWCCDKAEREHIPISYVAPTSIIYEWGISEVVLKTLRESIDYEEVNLREYILFNEPYVGTNYACGEFRQFEIDHDTYMHLLVHDFLHKDPRIPDVIYDALFPLIDALADSEYLFSISGVALSPFRSDYDAYLTGLNIYVFDESDPILAKMTELQTAFKSFIDDETLNISLEKAPAGNIHIAIFA